MIRFRLLVGFVLVALLPVIGVGIGTYIVSYHNGRQQSIDRLESVAARKEIAIQGWVQSLHQELLFASQAESSPKFISTALRLGNEGVSYPWYNNLLRIQLRNFLDQSSQLDELFLIDLQGDVIVSTDPEREKINYADTIIYQQALIQPATQLPFMDFEAGDDINGILSQDRFSIITAVPVYSVDSHLLGIMGGRASIEMLHTTLNEQTGLGKTGKAYLVNHNRAVLEGTRFGDTTIAEAETKSFIMDVSGIEDAIQTSGNHAGEYSGHNAEPVIGVYRWLPDLQIVLSVEQDRDEAYLAVSTTTALNLIIAFGALVIAVTASLFVTRSIADPIINLAITAAQIADGDLNRMAQVDREDEVGALARAFNSMTSQLRDLINSLEQNVEDRTRDLIAANSALEQRAVQMETSAQVGREITSILDLDVLLKRVVELIQDAFGYYHVQIFLLNKETRQLILSASSGNFISPSKAIDLNIASINGKAVQMSEVILVNDVSQCADFLFDEQLPETRSELVIPLKLGDQIIGTLDVNHNELNAFSEEDKLVIQSLGDQIVVAIENAHLYDQRRELAVLEERTRLARELHDSVTQSLYSLVLLTEGWRRMLNTASEAQVSDYLSRIGEISQQSLKEMRLLIHELRPPTLEQEGLVGALRKRLDAVEKRVGIEARVLMDELIELPASVEEGLYRITQEALNNALRHAAASKETVHFCVQDDQVIVQIIDDGCGFDPENLELTGGMGLAGMSERARQMGGSLSIESRPGAGTTITAIIPINKHSL